MPGGGLSLVGVPRRHSQRPGFAHKLLIGEVKGTPLGCAEASGEGRQGRVCDHARVGCGELGLSRHGALQSQQSPQP